MRYEHGSKIPCENDSLRVGCKGAFMSYASIVWYCLLWGVRGGEDLEVLLCGSIRLGTEVVDLLGLRPVYRESKHPQLVRKKYVHACSSDLDLPPAFTPPQCFERYQKHGTRRICYSADSKLSIKASLDTRHCKITSSGVQLWLRLSSYLLLRLPWRSHVSPATKVSGIWNDIWLWEELVLELGNPRTDWVLLKFDYCPRTKCPQILNICMDTTVCSWEWKRALRTNEDGWEV
jgi:hypothetical protein